MGKSARAAYGLDDVAIVPSRRTRDVDDIDLSWEIDAYRFDMPIMASPMDSVVSPATAVQLGESGAMGALHLEGLWTRYADPEPVLASIADAPDDLAIARLREAYGAPIDLDLVEQRIRDINASGVLSCAAVSPHRAEELLPVVLRSELDLLVIHGAVVSAEHVSTTDEPLNLKTFIRHLEIPVIVGGCASYQAALHLMRTGAAGVLVGVGSGASSTMRSVLGIGVPQATAIADARSARMRHLDETGVYAQVIADGAMATSGDIAKAIVCGADAVMIGAPLAASSDAPGKGTHWGMAARHPDLPRGERIRVRTDATLPERLAGLAEGLRRSMATCGYTDVKDFQKAALVIASAQAGR